jgi:hypothetical protein
MLSCNQMGNTRDGSVYEKGSADKEADLIGEIGRWGIIYSINQLLAVLESVGAS